MSPPARRPVALIGALLLLAAVVAGCATGDAAGTAQGSTEGDQSKGIPEGVVLRVGDQGQSQETLLRTSGQLDGIPYKVEFKAFLSGPLLVQGFNAGEIDVGGLGDLPASGAVAAKIPVKAVAVSKSTGPTLILLARPGVDSIEALRGKKVAYTTGTAQQAFAIRSLHSVGLHQADVQQVDVALQQLGTVLEAGRADAAVVQAGDALRYEDTHPGAVRLATSEKADPPIYGYSLATEKALADKGRSAAVVDYTRRLVRASAWAQAHPDAWVKAYYVGVNHQDPKFASRLNSVVGSQRYVPIDSSVSGSLQQVVDLLASEGAIKERFDVGPLYDSKVSARYNAVLDQEASR